MNRIDVATPSISASTTNLATKGGEVDTNILVDLNNRPLPLREDPPLEPSTEGRTHVVQPIRKIGPHPRYHAGETGSGIDEPTISEPRVDLEKDLELARLREIVCQVGPTEEPHVVGCDVFT
uniref:Uncharacterized protein n=1 Tax=Cannabis sativa TaxID=3483 RepID=A0A803QQK0_CANSA